MQLNREIDVIALSFAIPDILFIYIFLNTHIRPTCMPGKVPRPTPIIISRCVEKLRNKQQECASVYSLSTEIGIYTIHHIYRVRPWLRTECIDIMEVHSV